MVKNEFIKPTNLTKIYNLPRDICQLGADLTPRKIIHKRMKQGRASLPINSKDSLNVIDHGWNHNGVSCCLC